MNEDKKDMIVKFMSEDIYRPMRFRELCGFLGVPKTERENFKEILDSMISSGDITLTQQNTYKISEPDTFTGVFSASSRGFGFVNIPGRESDIFISPDNTNGAFDGDNVEVRITKWNEDGHSVRKPEGIILRVISRGHTEITGVFQKSKYFGFVVPDNQRIGKDIFIPKNKSKNVPGGSKVAVKILDYGTSRRNPEGEITQIFGMADDPKTDFATIVHAYDLSEVFPEEVMRETDRIPDHVTEEDISGRRDLRDIMTVTIDGEDARDLDDAVTLRKHGENYVLGVHIADVTNYVTENSAVDKEALRRGTSVYLINRVIPMLPQKLSNGICSLNEGQDRLTLSCIMEIDSAGAVVDHEICESVINVNHRMSYTQVARLLDSEDDCGGVYDDAVEMLREMKKLSDIIRTRRIERGSIDFDFPESKIILNDDDLPIDIHPYEINDANRIIEDFMLMANETVAQDYYWQEIPFVYRSHESPDPDRIWKLSVILKNCGFNIRTGRNRIYPKEFQKLLGRIQGSPEETFISRLVLRSMKQARYTTENLGHFGLAVSYYCHFTSPIRRYPDLQIHRIIKENIHGRLDENRLKHYKEILPEVARDSSLNERKADEAERDIEKIKKMEYMSEFIGMNFEGIISGITNWGIYVTLENTCEGLVRLETLSDYYIYDEKEAVLNGMDHGRTFRIGDTVSIKVSGVDAASRTVLFKLRDEVSVNGRKKHNKTYSK